MTSWLGHPHFPSPQTQSFFAILLSWTALHSKSKGQMICNLHLHRPELQGCSGTWRRSPLLCPDSHHLALPTGSQGLLSSSALSSYLRQAFVNLHAPDPSKGNKIADSYWLYVKSVLCRKIFEPVERVLTSKVDIKLLILLIRFLNFEYQKHSNLFKETGAVLYVLFS